MNPLIGFWEFARKLKTEPRKGWAKKLGLQRPESVADHSFALALLCLFEGQRRGYNVDKMIKLAVLHDLEEAITGDLTPEEKKAKGKLAVESQRNSAREQLLRYLLGKDKKAYNELWSELDKSKTREARLVHDLDKLEMALQANAYSKNGVGIDKLQEFHESAKNAIKDPQLRKLLREISP